MWRMYICAVCLSAGARSLFVRLWLVSDWVSCRYRRGACGPLSARNGAFGRDTPTRDCEFLWWDCWKRLSARSSHFRSVSRPPPPLCPLRPLPNTAVAVGYPLLASF